MAKNLQSKLKPEDKVSIFDVNEDAMRRLETELKAGSSGAGVEIAASAFDASKNAVSLSLPPRISSPSPYVMRPIVLSMI